MTQEINYEVHISRAEGLIEELTTADPSLVEYPDIRVRAQQKIIEYAKKKLACEETHIPNPIQNQVTNLLSGIHGLGE